MRVLQQIDGAVSLGACLADAKTHLPAEVQEGDWKRGFFYKRTANFPASATYLWAGGLFSGSGRLAGWSNRRSPGYMCDRAIVGCFSHAAYFVGCAHLFFLLAPRSGLLARPSVDVQDWSARAPMDRISHVSPRDIVAHKEQQWSSTMLFAQRTEVFHPAFQPRFRKIRGTNRGARAAAVQGPTANSHPQLF